MKGYTLAELMVTLVLIAAVLALAVPTVDRVIQRRREASCANNMKQLWTAAANYRAFAH